MRSTTAMLLLLCACGDRGPSGPLGTLLPGDPGFDSCTFARPVPENAGRSEHLERWTAPGTPITLAVVHPEHCNVTFVPDLESGPGGATFEVSPKSVRFSATVPGRYDVRVTRGEGTATLLFHVEVVDAPMPELVGSADATCAGLGIWEDQVVCSTATGILLLAGRPASPVLEVAGPIHGNLAEFVTVGSRLAVFAPQETGIEILLFEPGARTPSSTTLVSGVFRGATAGPRETLLVGTAGVDELVLSRFDTSTGRLVLLSRGGLGRPGWPVFAFGDELLLRDGNGWARLSPPEAPVVVASGRFEGELWVPIDDRSVVLLSKFQPVAQSPFTSGTVVLLRAGFFQGLVAIPGTFAVTGDGAIVFDWSDGVAVPRAALPSTSAGGIAISKALVAISGEGPAPPSVSLYRLPARRIPEPSP